MDSASHLGRAARLQFAASVAKATLQLVTQLVVARLFGPHLFLLFNTAQSGLQTAATFGRLSTDAAVLRAPESLVGPTSRAAALLALSGGALASLPLVIAAIVASVAGNADIGLAYLTAALAVPVATALVPVAATIQRNGRFAIYALVNSLAEPLARLGLIALVVLTAGPARLVLWVLPVAAGAALVAALTAAWSRLRRSSNKPEPALSLGNSSGRYLTVASAAQATQAGLLLVALTVVATIPAQTAEAAAFAAAARVSAVALWIQVAFAVPLLPKVAQATNEERLAAVRVQYQHSLDAILLFNSALFVFLALAGAEVMTLFGKDYRSGAVYLVLLAGAQWVNSATALTEDVLVLQGRPGRLMLINTLCLGSAALALIVFKNKGVMTLALIYASAIVLANVARAHQSHMLFRLAIDRQTTIMFGVTTAAYALGGSGLAQLLPSMSPLTAMALAAIWSTLAAGTALALMHPDRRQRVFLIMRVDRPARSPKSPASGAAS